MMTHMIDQLYTLQQIRCKWSRASSCQSLSRIYKGIISPRDITRFYIISHRSYFILIIHVAEPGVAPTAETHLMSWGHLKRQNL